MTTTTESKTKQELLARHTEEMANHFRRAQQQLQVIKALPEGVKVDKAYTTPEQIKRGGHSAAHGIYELTVRTYGHLWECVNTFLPVPMARIEMERAGKDSPSLSFYPTARVPPKWHEKHTVEPVAPLVWQASPFGSGPECRVNVEWYTKCSEIGKPDLYILIRVRVLEHGASYRAFSNGGVSWSLRGYPAGLTRFNRLVEDGPPFVSVWWNQFGPENSLPATAPGVPSLVAHLEGGPRQ
jgi:hypothetical protein